MILVIFRHLYDTHIDYWIGSSIDIHVTLTCKTCKIDED
jgi:hypothetical protein